MVNIPSGATKIIQQLESCGYEAYLVGGCVRDLVLGMQTGQTVIPHDFDICTNAVPEQVRSALSGQRILDTGIKHGTVTVLMPDGQYEVTTFRVDGQYSDSRHPDEVRFTGKIEEDLARRDFTVNAMAMSLTGDPSKNIASFHLVDPYGGAADLRRGIIRCVGDASERFHEDALRILRAIRFAARLNFSIDYLTQAAMHETRSLLSKISGERIFSEMSQILAASRGWDYLHSYSDVLCEIMPEFKPAIGLDQNNKYHCYNVFDHIIMSLSFAPQDTIVRWALLLHDLGKPATKTTGVNGWSHFYGHGAVSEDLARDILNRLHVSNQFKHDVLQLVRDHDAPVAATERFCRRMLNKYGADQTRRLMQVHRADTLAHSTYKMAEHLKVLDDADTMLEALLLKSEAFQLGDLAINGQDLLNAGLPQGPEIGAALQRALDAVLDGRCENSYDELMQVALQRDT